jgi:hypothetical protein
MKFKIGDYVRVVKKDWDEVPVGAVLEIVRYTEKYEYYQLHYNGENFPFAEDEITLATELEKALA